MPACSPERLPANRAKMDTSSVDAGRAFAARLARFDSSKEAVLARKYEAATERGLYRALRELQAVEAAGESEDVNPDEIEASETVGSFLPVAKPEVKAAAEDEVPVEERAARPAQAPIPTSKKDSRRTIRPTERISLDEDLSIIAKI